MDTRMIGWTFRLFRSRMVRRNVLVVLFLSSLLFVTIMQISVVHPSSRSSSSSSSASFPLPPLEQSNELLPAEIVVNGSTKIRPSYSSSSAQVIRGTNTSSSSSSKSASSSKKKDILRIEALVDRSRLSDARTFQTLVNVAQVKGIIRSLQERQLLDSTYPPSLMTDETRTSRTFNRTSVLSSSLREQEENELNFREKMTSTNTSEPDVESRPLVSEENTFSPPILELNDDEGDLIRRVNQSQQLDQLREVDDGQPQEPSRIGGRNQVLEPSKHVLSTNSSSSRVISSVNHRQVNDSRATPTSLCPLTPPSLIGRVRIELEPEVGGDDMTSIVTMNPDVEAGGHFSPKFCVARHKVAIIIPYRDRLRHLQILLYHLHPIIQRQLLDYQVFVVEQFGSDTFNKGVLMNSGVIEALKVTDFDCFIFHDVDLIPEDDRNLYQCPPNPRHMSYAVDKFNYTLPYYYLVGGVFAISRKHLIQVNGYSNLYWGWGAEDDDMAHRLKLQNLPIIRPPASIGRYTMIKHDHRAESPSAVRTALLRMAKRRSARDGLNSVRYRVVSKELKPLYTHLLIEIGHIHKWHFPAPNKLVLHFR